MEASITRHRQAQAPAQCRHAWKAVYCLAASTAHLGWISPFTTIMTRAMHCPEPTHRPAAFLTLNHSAGRRVRREQSPLACPPHACFWMSPLIDRI